MKIGPLSLSQLVAQNTLEATTKEACATFTSTAPIIVFVALPVIKVLATSTIQNWREGNMPKTLMYGIGTTIIAVPAIMTAVIACRICLLRK